MPEHFDRTFGSATTFLSRWQGANARLRELTVSRRRLQIVIWDGEDYRWNLCIGVLDPVWMSGPFDWSGCAIAIEVVPASSAPARDLLAGDWMFRRSVSGAGFEIFTASLSVSEHVHLR